MNSKCGVESKRRFGSHESCVCIVGFPACGCQKKSVVYETECIDMKHSERKAEPEPFIALKHIQATLYSIRSEMGSQCSFFFPGEVLSGGDGVPREQVLQQSSEFSGEDG